MTSKPETKRLLIKGQPKAVRAALTYRDTRMEASFRPLFQNIGSGGGPGMVAPTSWQVMELQTDGRDVNLWQMCHDLMGENGLGIGETLAPEFAEPDFEQKWNFGPTNVEALRMTSSCEVEEPQRDDYPKGNGPLWFRDAEHGRFDLAHDDLVRAGLRQPGAGVRIAHLDTGYDPSQLTTPVNLARALQRNFVDEAFPNDATDRTEGMATQLGHGTGTLAILAGANPNGGPPIGGAPFAEVVPVRVANRVVLFSNSTVAQAFDYVYGLRGDPATRVDVITMSMGGVASAAWADAVNALYEAGVFIVAAAGNNYGNMPARNIVYPARFRRVVAACGVMANQKPYADLDVSLMAGNYGPASKMTTALAAFTPNTPWARLGCARAVDHNGGGTSSATPQIAAAAALWIQKNRAALERYSQGWMRVEAVRKALFESARISDDPLRFGRGALRADAVLAVPPAAESELRAESKDDASYALWQLLGARGFQGEPDARQRMLELEARQLSQSAALEAVLPDPDQPPESLSPAKLREIAEALADQPGASPALKKHLGQWGRPVSPPAPFDLGKLDAMRQLHLKSAMAPPVADPTHRMLRIFATDPAAATQMETLPIYRATLGVRWEELEPGPVGEYLEIVDVDPASACCYAPVDLDHRHILVTEGLTPSESNPQFHQQMVYAVAMKTIECFELALGRTALWSSRLVGSPVREEYVQRLRVYPHALRQANAYYSPDKKALLFGYFKATGGDPGTNLPGGMVFGCLSHDIIAHETTHALLDGLHRRYIEATNPDTLAFHEAFADIVALFQHFSIPEALRHQIARTRGDLGQDNLLAELAVQFGQATGRYGALRNAIGGIDRETKQWQPRPPSKSDLANATEPHDRGAVLVAAVFDAFLKI